MRCRALAAGVTSAVGGTFTDCLLALWFGMFCKSSDAIAQWRRRLASAVHGLAPARCWHTASIQCSKAQQASCSIAKKLGLFALQDGESPLPTMHAEPQGDNAGTLRHAQPDKPHSPAPQAADSGNALDRLSPQDAHAWRNGCKQLAEAIDTMSPRLFEVQVFQIQLRVFGQPDGC